MHDIGCQNTVQGHTVPPVVLLDTEASKHALPDLAVALNRRETTLPPIDDAQVHAAITDKHSYYLRSPQPDSEGGGEMVFPGPHLQQHTVAQPAIAAVLAALPAPDANTIWKPAKEQLPPQAIPQLAALRHEKLVVAPHAASPPLTLAMLQHPISADGAVVQRTVFRQQGQAPLPPPPEKTLDELAAMLPLRAEPVGLLIHRLGGEKPEFRFKTHYKEDGKQVDQYEIEVLHGSPAQSIAKGTGALMAGALPCCVGRRYCAGQWQLALCAST